MKQGSHTIKKDGARGTKLCVSTGLDNSSAGQTGTSSLKPKMGGGRDSLSHSISGASVAKQG